MGSLEDKSLRIITAEGCHFCEDVKQALESGRLDVVGAASPVDEVEIIDVTTPEGYPYFDALGVRSIPSAFYGSQECKILVNAENYVIDCRTDNGQEEERRDKV